MGKLGQLLVSRGWITVQQLTRALQNQNSVGGRLGTCLLEMEVLGEDLLARSLSEQLGVPAAVIEDLRAIPDEVLHLIPEKLARRCRAIPFRLAGGRLDVAMQDPRNLVCQDEIAFACGRRVKIHVLPELRIFEAMQRYYREECPSRYSFLLDRLNRARYLWGARAEPAADGGKADHDAGPAPAGPPPGVRTGTPEKRMEVLSALPFEGLLAGPPRFVPPPLPEPSLPSQPRRRSLFRSRATAGPGKPQPDERSASGTGRQPEPPGTLLPPLEELDFRAPPRRPDATEAARQAKTPELAEREPLAPAAPPTDLEATNPLGPPEEQSAHRAQAAPPLPPRAAPPPAPAWPASARAASEPPRRKVALTATERAELGFDQAPAAAAAPAPAASAAPASAPAAAAAAASAPAAAAVPAPTTLAAIEEAFASTTDREEVGRILLAFLAQSFRRVALFQTNRGQITAWMAHGEGLDQEAFAHYTASFAEPSVFLNLRQGSGVHIGPLPPMAAHRELSLCWGGGLPRDCLMLPVRLRARLVAVIYVDHGSRGVGAIDLDRMRRLAAATEAAFERCILSKKFGYPQS